MYCMCVGVGCGVDLVNKGDTKNPWLIAHQVKHHVYLGRASHMLSDKFFLLIIPLVEISAINVINKKIRETIFQ